MKKRILSLALAMAMLFALLPVTARAAQTGTVGDNITWTFEETTGTLTMQGTGKIEIEYGDPVDELNIKHLVIGEGITGIGYDAFNFQKSLVSVKLPASLKLIDICAFESCVALTEIDIPAGVTEIGANAFAQCTALKKVTLHQGMKTIWHHAFYNAGLTEVSVPASVTSIGEGAFSCRTLQKISVDAQNRNYVADEQGILYTADMKTLLLCPAGKTGSVYIHENCTRLSEYALEYATGITDLYIPAGTDIWPAGNGDLGMTLDGASNLQNIWFAEGHEEFISRDGLVLNAEYLGSNWDENGEDTVTVPTGTQLCYVPAGRSGYFEVPEGITRIWHFAMTASGIRSVKLPKTLTSIFNYEGSLGTMRYMTHLLFTGEKPTGPDYDLHDVTVYYPSWLESWSDPSLTDWEEANITYIPYDQDKVPLLPGQTDETFTDVPADIWYTEPVRWAVERGITEGMGDGSFGSERNCSRAQIVTFLWRAMGRPQLADTECPFTDVADDEWYTTPVLWAVENGITNGVGNGLFGTHTDCSRAQIVTFLWRAADCPEPAGGDCPFTDVDSDQWYSKAVLWAVEQGITNGLGNGTFGVNRSCTRAQAVTFLYRAFAK